MYSQFPGTRTWTSLGPLFCVPQGWQHQSNQSTLQKAFKLTPQPLPVLEPGNLYNPPRWPIFHYSLCDIKSFNVIRISYVLSHIWLSGENGETADFQALCLAFAGLQIPHQIPDCFSNSSSHCLLSVPHTAFFGQIWHNFSRCVFLKLLGRFQLYVLHR